MSIADQTTLTAQELLSLPDSDACSAFSIPHLGSESSWVGGQILAILREYQCFDHDKQRVRRPDVSLVCYGRFKGETLPQRHTTIPPDLAVEVVSPNDLFEEVMEKVEDYLRVGVRAVWVVNPRARDVAVYRQDGTITHVGPDDTLVGDGPLEGFECPVVQFFPPTVGVSKV